MPTTLRGVINYTSNQPDRLGVDRGREHFAMTLNADGSRSLRSHCVIQDAPLVERDVQLSVSADFVPQHALVRIRVGDRDEGAAIFRFDGRRVHSAGYTLEGEHYVEDHELPVSTGFFVTHPIQADAWLLASLAAGPEPGIFQVANFPTCSNDHRGASGPRLCIHEPAIDIHFLGREHIHVAAGDFDALHFCYGDPAVNPMGSNRAGEHPRYHVWTSAEGHYVLLRARVDGYMQTEYELVSLSEGATGAV